MPITASDETVHCWVAQRQIHYVLRDPLVRFDLLGPDRWGCSVLADFPGDRAEVYAEGPTPRAAIEAAWQEVSAVMRTEIEEDNAYYARMEAKERREADEAWSEP